MTDNKRIELKAIFSSMDLSLVEKWIYGKSKLLTLFPDRYVNNIYFETHDYSSASDNIYGISNRTKVRLRWYGSKNIGNEFSGFLEFKRKKNNLGWKDQYPVKLSNKDFNNFIFLKNKISVCIPLKNQIEFSNYNLPFILNRYKRKYFSSDDKKIRVTLDTSVKAFDQRWSNFLSRKNEIVLPNVNIIEFKFNKKFKEEAIELIKKLPLRITKHSKYTSSTIHV